jgi:hypothetical protein
MFKRCFFALMAIIPMLGVCSSPLSFGAPMTVSGSSLLSNYSSPGISATNDGFMLCWQNPSNDVIGSLSTTLGASWSPTTVGMDSVAYPSVAGNQNGFVAVWVVPPPGFGYGAVDGSFFDQESQMWGDPVVIDNSMNSDAPAFVGSCANGFIATWTRDYNSVYANVSTDGVTWQPSSVQIGGTYSLSSVSGCGNGELFLVAWFDSATGSIYVATSANDGTSWNGPYTAVSGVATSDDYGVGCFGNDQGFLLAYADESNNIWSVFSANGVDWGSPVQIGSDFQTGYAIFPSVSGTNEGFVVAWAGGDSNAYASFSGDNGTSWSSPPNAITSGGPVAVYSFASVNISAYNDHCMASWMQSNGVGGYDAVVSLSPFPSSSSGPRKDSGGLLFPVTPNKPGFRLNR